MAIRKCVAVRLGVINDFKATNRREGVLSTRTPSTPAYSWESNKPSSRQEYTKTTRQKSGEVLTFCLEKRQKQYIFYNILTGYNYKMLCEEQM